MRVLSARIARVRRNRAINRVEALVALAVLRDGATIRALVPISVPADAAGAAPLRDRLLREGLKSLPLLA